MRSGWNGNGIEVKLFRKYRKVENKTEFVIAESLVNEFFHLTGEMDDKGFYKFDMVLNIKEGKFYQSKYEKDLTLNPKHVKFIEWVD